MFHAIICMPSNWIVNLQNCIYPAPGQFNLRELEHDIFNRYYASFVDRLESGGFNFPQASTYRRAFNRGLLPSFIVSHRNGIVVDPGEGLRWLVFVHDGAAVAPYVVRYAVVLDGYVQLFGENGGAEQYVISEATFASGIAVPVSAVQGLSAGGVKVL